MKGMFNFRSRLTRSLAGILAVLMVVTSINVTPVSAYAEELTETDYDYVTVPVEEIGATEDVSSSPREIKEKESASSVETEERFETSTETEEETEEEAPGEEQQYDVSAAKDVILDVEKIFENNSLFLYITEEGYCVGTPNDITNPYIPFRNITFTGTLSNSSNSIYVNGMPEGGKMIFDNLQVLGNNCSFLYVYTDLTLEMSGQVRLTSYVRMGSSGPSSSTIFIGSSSTLKLSGNADLYWNCPISGGSSFISGYQNASLITEDYTGNIYLDWSKGNSSMISFYSGEVSLETVGTITIKSGGGAPAITATDIILSGSEVNLSNTGGGNVFGATNTTINSEGNINIKDATSAPFFSNSSLSLNAGGDIVVSTTPDSSSSTALYMFVSGSQTNIKAKGSVYFTAPDIDFGDKSNCKTSANYTINSQKCSIEAGKDIIYRRNMPFINCNNSSTGEVYLSAGNNLEISGYHPTSSLEPIIKNVHNCDIAVGGDFTVNGDWDGIVSGNTACIDVAGSFKAEGIYSEAQLFSLADFKISTGKDMIISGKITGNMFTGTEFDFYSKGDIKIANDVSGAEGADHVFSAGTVSIKADGDISLTNHRNYLLYGGTFTIDAGKSINIEATSTGNSDIAYIAGGEYFDLSAKKDIKITCSAAQGLFRCSDASFSAKENIILKNTHANALSLFEADSVSFKDAKMVSLYSASTGGHFISTVVNVNIPGSFEAVQTGGSYKNLSGSILNFENATDVTIKAKGALYVGTIKLLNISGTLDIENSAGPAVIFESGKNYTAKNIKITSNSDTISTANGSDYILRADSVVIKNNGKAMPVGGDATVVAKKASFVGDVSGEEVGTDNGFTSDTDNEARIINLESATVVATIKDSSTEINSLEDVDYAVYCNGEIVPDYCYTVSLGKSDASLDNFDTIVVKAVNLTTVKDCYAVSEISTLIDIEKRAAIKVSVPEKDDKTFSSLETALKYANSNTGSTITLNEDVSVSHSLKVRGNVTIDMNGHDVSGSDESALLFNYGTLTVKDSSELKSGRIIANEGYYNAITNSGTLTIESGNVYGVYNYYRVTITGGVIYAFFQTGPTKPVITGGTFKTLNLRLYNYAIYLPTIASVFDGQYGLRSSKNDEWINLSSISDGNILEDVYVSNAKTDIGTLADSFGSFEYDCYLDGTAYPALSDVSGNCAGLENNEDFTVGTFICGENVNGVIEGYLPINGIGGYYGTLELKVNLLSSAYYSTLSSTMEVTNAATSTDDVVLPTGWSWKEKVELTNVGDTTGNEAVAVFFARVGHDSENYYSDKTITIYRSECDHTEGEGRYASLSDIPDCEHTGLLTYYCTKCGKAIRTETIPAEGHNYKVIFNWQYFTASSSYLTYAVSCDKCSYSINSYINASYDVKKTVNGNETIWTAYLYLLLNDRFYSDSYISYDSGYSVNIPEGIDYFYTGAAVKPVPTVYYGTTKLVQGTDYTISYSNNVKPNRDFNGKVLLQGYDKKKNSYYELVPTITIKGKGNYTGSVNLSFNIYRSEMSEATVEYGGKGENGCYFTVPAKGKSISPVKSVSMDGNKLPSTDYTVSCYKAEDIAESGNYEDCTPISLKDIPAGKYVVIVEGKNNTCYYQEGKIEVVSYKYFLSDAKIGFKNNKVNSIKIGSKSFAPDSFSIKYPLGAQASAVGKHEVTITPIVSKLGDTFCPDPITVTYTVAATSINSKWFAVSGTKPVYDGTAKNNEVSITSKAPSGLILGKDYTVTYSNNINAGTATALVTGIGNYKGSVKLTYKISATALNDTYAVTYDATAPISKAGARVTNLVVKNAAAVTLVEGRDYIVSYKNNTKLGTGKLIISGKGNYSGKLEKTFTVVNRSIASKGIEITAKDIQFKKDGAYKGAVTVTDNGKKLKQNTDYTVTYEAKALNLRAEDIAKDGYIVLEATVTGKGAYATVDDKNKPESVTVSYRVAVEKVTSLKVTVDASKCVYSEGKPVKPVVKVEYGVKVGLKTVYYTLDSSQYTVEYQNNTKSGTGKVTVTGTKKYLGSKTVSYKISARTISK